MTAFNLEESLARARQRLGGASEVAPKRRRRSDAGRARLAPAVASQLRALLSGQERPSVTQVRRSLRTTCVKVGCPLPSRSTIYAAMARATVRRHRVAELPPPVRRALYNLDGTSEVPGHQLVFYAFNYGDLRALMYAASLPWLDLYLAERLSGWRPKSRALLRAVMQHRGI